MVIFEFKKVHFGCRVEDGLPKGRMEARERLSGSGEKRLGEIFRR